MNLTDLYKKAGIISKVVSPVKKYIGDVTGKNVVKAKEALRQKKMVKDPFLDEVLTAPGQSKEELLNKALASKSKARTGTAIGIGGLGLGAGINGDRE